MPNLPAIIVYMLAKLAFGKNEPEISFYKPLQFEKYNCQFSEETAEIVEYNVSSPITNTNNTLVTTDDHLDNHNIDQQYDEYVYQIQ